MSGMVTTPVVTTFDTALPEIVPNSAEPTTEILALPPRDRPVAAIARSVKKAPPPAAKRSWPKKTNSRTMMVPTASGVEKTALGSKPTYCTRRTGESALPINWPGTLSAKSA